VQGIDARVHQKDAELESYFPKVSAFGVADYANPNQRIFPQEDKYTGTWAVGVQATWNLNDALTADVNQHRLQAQADELRADQESFVRQARIEVLQAQQNVQLALSDMKTTATGLKSAEESYRVRKELLAAERATAVELVDSETDLTRARISAINARIDLRVAIAQLIHALGDDVPKH
jgi:outer membrane protein TolC